MDKYKPKKGKIFRGIILLFLFFFVMWFIAEGFIIYTSFADNYAYRSISGYYVDGRVTRLLKIPEEHRGKVDKIEAEYRIGFQRVRSYLPAELFYHEGLEVGDKIPVPYHRKCIKDMSGTDKIILSVSFITALIFLIRAICIFAGEIYASKYFRRLILNKVYVYASFVRSENVRKRLRAVCSYQNHIFKSKWYKAEKYPFKSGGEIRVYVDLLKNSQKYLISEV